MLSVTGHRPNLLGGYHVQPRLDHFALTVLAELMPERVATGMAQGWDQAVASACVVPGIPFVAVLPGINQVAKWPAPAVRRYGQLLTAADQVEQMPFDAAGIGRAFHAHDERLVVVASQVLALWNGDPRTGTGMTVRMARERSVPVVNVWEGWQDAQ